MNSFMYTITVFLMPYFYVRLMFGHGWFVSDHLEVIDGGECPCPGNNLTLQCSSANGSAVGSIAWSGSAFDCDSEGNEILFQLAGSNNGIRTCNNGTIVGWILSTNFLNETFTSMLNVSINSSLIGKNIICSYIENMTEILENYSIPAIDPVVTIDYTLMGPNLLNFNWNISASNYSECPLNVITYNIKALNCGSCPTTTNHTNATCKYTSNAGTRCVFTLKFVMCGRDFQESITADIPPSTNANSAILPILITISILMLLVSLISFAVVIKLMCSVHSRRMIKATDQIQAQNRPQFIEKDCNVYDTIDEDYQTENNIVKTVDNKIVGIYCSGLEGRQYEEYTPRFGEGVLNVENILIHLRGRVTFKWYKFGIALGVSSKILEQLEGSLDEDALTEVLGYWLKNHSSEPSWKEVSNALQDIIT